MMGMAGLAEIYRLTQTRFFLFALLAVILISIVGCGNYQGENESSSISISSIENVEFPGNSSFRKTGHLSENEDSAFGAEQSGDGENINIHSISRRIEERIVVLVADEWPPYNFEQNSSHKGFVIDVAREIFTPSGYRIIYRVLPWTRALKGTLLGYYDGAVAASRIEGPDLVFHDTPVVVNRVSFFTSKDSKWLWEGQESLENQILGVASGYDYNTFINKYIHDNSGNGRKVQIVSGERPIHQNLMKLINGRVQIVAGNRGTINFIAAEQGLQHEIRFAGLDKRDDSLCYIAFTPVKKRGETLAILMNTGMDRLRRTGVWSLLLKKYGLSDSEAESEMNLKSASEAAFEGDTERENGGHE
jgi:polar amino acid transport system substrate-binding protein